MLILPPGHAQAARLQRRLTRRERWMIGSVLTVVAAVILAVVISISTAGHSTGNGCIDVNIPFVTGGQEIYRCGSAARSTCASVGVPGGYAGEAGRSIAVECRKAGLPV